MPAPAELQFDTIYHIWNRGVNHSTIFRDDENYRYFLKLYIHHIEPVAETFAYCLLPNHFHLLIHTHTETDQREYRRTVQGDPTGFLPPSQAFSNFFNAYVRAFNKRFSRSGGLFEDRFGRKPVKTDTYLAQLVMYIHQNPLKHGLVDDIRDWRYSSYDALATGKTSRVNRTEVMSWFGSVSNFVASHRKTSEVSEDL